MSFRTIKTRLGVAVAGALMLCASGASAGVVISPTSTFNNTLGQFNSGLSPVNMINQSGVTPFVSGVTDLGTYLGSSPTHGFLVGGNAWATPGGNTAGSIDFDLGANFNIGTFILWGDHSTTEFSSAPQAFSLIGSLTADFSVSTVLGNFSGAPASAAPVPAQVFNFAATSTRYVRWSI